MTKIIHATHISKIKNILWPIESTEYKKFLPLAAMIFCILFNYSAFRSIKDGLIVTSIGPEAISFLKTYLVLPSAILMMIIYTKLCNIMSQQKVFYIITCSFLLYIIVFTFILYPFSNIFHPDLQKIKSLCDEYPNFKWFIKIAGNWSYASFYVVAELWGNMILSLLFWQLANQITTHNEVRRFYPMFGLVGNCSLLTVAVVLRALLDQSTNLVANHIKFIPVLSITILSGVVILFLYHWIDHKVMKNTVTHNTESNIKTKKLNVKDSIKMILSSGYLGLLALFVISYGISINLVEGIWKSKIKEMYPSKEAYTLFMSTFQAYQGIVAIIFMFIGSNILRRLSWKKATMFTPLMMLSTGVVFFLFIVFEKFSAIEIAAFIGTGPLLLVVIIGSVQNILTKATKYSLFDSTKEMVYMHIDNELKTKGKAAVDVIASRCGKSLGGVIQSTFFMILPTATFESAVPFFASIFFMILGLWIWAIQTLNTAIGNKINNTQ